MPDEYGSRNKKKIKEIGLGVWRDSQYFYLELWPCMPLCNCNCLTNIKLGIRKKMVFYITIILLQIRYLQKLYTIKNKLKKKINNK
jgi:hypothetical protein